MGHRWKKSHVPPKRHESECVKCHTFVEAEEQVKEVWRHATIDREFDPHILKYSWYMGFRPHFQSQMVAHWDSQKGDLWIKFRMGQVNE